MHDLDRFDRMLLAGSAPRTDPQHPAPQVVPARPVVRAEVITSKRGPRFADYTACPLCGHPRIGVVYLGVSIKGPKMHELFAHSPGVGMVKRGQPRCLGSGLRIEFRLGEWRGVSSP